MLCAHMDSIGFIVTHIEKDGFLRVGKLGGISPQEGVYTPIRFRNEVRGVFVKEEKPDFGTLKLDACYIDIGAQDRAQAEKMVQLGDTAVFDTPTYLNGQNLVSPYLDNRISCAILLQVLAHLPQNLPNDLYFVFSVQEEVGLRGAKTAAWAIAPDYALAVDVTDVNDTPGTDRCGTAQLGKGVAVKYMDHSIICHSGVVNALNFTARENHLTIQRDILRTGGTDAGAIHISRSGIRTGGLSIPCRYLHTPVEMAALSDIQACIQLLSAVIEKNFAVVTDPEKN